MPRNKRFQHGSIFKRGTRVKVWVARWWEEVIASDGTRDRVRRSEVLGSVAEIPTRRQAEQILSDRLRPINSGDYRPQSTWTLKNYVEDRWKPETFPTLKYSSQKHYEYIIDNHLLPEFGNVQLRLITRDDVQRFITSKLKRLSWKTAKHIRTAFGTILQSAMTEGIIPDNVVRKTKFPRRGPVEEKPSISTEQLLLLIEQLDEPAKSIAWVLALTGLRIGELLALRWRNVDLESRSIHVRETVYEGHFDVPKTKRSRRTVPLSAKAYDVLKALGEVSCAADELVFSSRNGTALCRRNLLNRDLKPAAEKLGMTGINWHWFRHVFATLLSSVGTPLGSAQAMLGHSSSEMTAGTYMHSLPEDQRKAAENVEQKLIGPKRTQVAWDAVCATSAIQ